MQINSSLISDAEWDDANGLTVTFKSNGSRYNYPTVDFSLWQDFQAAESQGKFFKANIQGKHEGSRL